MRKSFIIFVLFFAILIVRGQDVLFSKADSVKVTSLLRLAKTDRPSNLMLYFAHKLEDVPYVPATLEVSKTERLIVNLRQLDCSTYVETVMALSLTAKAGSQRWSDYCANLARIRYRDGRPEGYASRNHYKYWWVESNLKKGLITLPEIPATLRRRQTLDIHFMSSHVNSYPMLKAGGTKVLSEIRRMEKASTGKTMYYIPQANLAKSREELSCVRDGDILAIVTRRNGLDTSHVGIAEWGSDGLLHMIHASKLKKKVFLDTRPLYKYMATQRLQQGIWVIRPRL